MHSELQEQENRVINRIDKKVMFSLIFSYLLLVIALQATLYMWISAITVLFVLWRFLFQQKRTNLPSVGVINTLAIGCSALIFYFSLEGGVLAGMTNLLLLATSMKLLSLNRPQEVKNLCLAFYFAIASAFIFKQEIGFSMFVLFIFVVNTYSLLMVHTPGLDIRKRLKFGSRFLLTSLPLILFLFALTPRLGPLWKMPNAKGQSTGLSEHISPGDFSNLAQSSKLAFRATFEGKIPEHQDLYWRTMVHERFDGKQWSVHRLRKSSQNITPVSNLDAALVNQQTIDYKIIAEPSFQTWLYVLDTPVGHSDGLFYHLDRRLTRKRPISQQFQYQVSSVPVHQNQSYIFTLERHINLLMPMNQNPRTIAFAKALKAKSKSDLDYVNKVLSYYVDKKFTYTLQPNLMPVNPVDQFLFDDQAGFCSHFASSFAVLMRAAGIPARIVSGYQGGERADGDEFVSVYQYEAHAWNEVWLQDRGWVRFDPTATVSPERIAQGLQAAMQNEQSFLSDEMFSLVKYRQIALVNWLRSQMNNMDFMWSSWVLNFDTQKQSRLFESLWGRQNATTYGLYIALAFTGFMILVYALSRGRPIKQDHSAIAILHNKTRNIGVRFGLDLPISTPPLSYLDALVAHEPELEEIVTPLKAHYQACLYKSLTDNEFNEHLSQIRKQLKQLKSAAPSKYGLKRKT